MIKKIVYYCLKIVFRIIAPKRPIVTTHVRKILVIKLCCIGDVLFTTPLTRSLKENLPHAKLAYMVTNWCRPLVEADQAVDDVITFDAYDKVGFLNKIKKIVKTVRLLRKKKFDLAIILHRTPLAGLLTAFGGIPVRIGFDWEGQGFCHTHPVLFNAAAHEIERNLDCLKPLGFISRSKQTQLEPDEDALRSAMELLEKAGYKKDSRPLIAIFPGGGVNPGTTMTSKRWTLVGYSQLCELLATHYQAHLLLIGSENDRIIGDELVADSGLEKNIMRFEGRTTLMTLAGILKQCHLFIGGDSGPLHMADATGVSTISIFGPTDPELLAPQGKRHRIIRNPVACSPCFTPLVLDTIICKERSMLCMTSITAQQVFEVTEEVLLEKGYIRQ